MTQNKVCRAFSPYKKKTRPKRTVLYLFSSTLASLQAGAKYKHGSMNMVAYTASGGVWGDSTPCGLSPPLILRPAVLQQDRAEPARQSETTLFRTLINIQVNFK